jgi:hypothetical protein
VTFSSVNRWENRRGTPSILAMGQLTNCLMSRWGGKARSLKGGSNE